MIVPYFGCSVTTISGFGAGVALGTSTTVGVVGVTNTTFFGP